MSDFDEYEQNLVDKIRACDKIEYELREILDAQQRYDSVRLYRKELVEGLREARLGDVMHWDDGTQPKASVEADWTLGSFEVARKLAEETVSPSRLLAVYIIPPRTIHGLGARVSSKPKNPAKQLAKWVLLAYGKRKGKHHK